MIFIIKMGEIVLNFIYFFLKLLPTKSKITFISRQSDSPSKEFMMIYDEIKKQKKNIEVIMLCRTLEGGVKASFIAKIKYGFHMFKQMYHIATSKVILLDSYCIVVSILKHKKNITIIQMWHSMGSMKKFGYTAIDTEEGSKKKLAYAMKMHQNYDFVFASSEVYKEHLAQGFGCDINKIITMPLPRLDLLENETYEKEMKSKIYNKYPELEHRLVILYCPTFRKNEGLFNEALNKLVGAIDFGKYQLVVKKHPLSKVKISEKVIQAEEFSSFDMLFVADYLISDYSCIIYEAAVKNIPLYFYNYDMELYSHNRGLAIDYEKELPGIISKDAETIIEAIDNSSYDMGELERFSKKYVVRTEHATLDIASFILARMI